MIIHSQKYKFSPESDIYIDFLCSSCSLYDKYMYSIMVAFSPGYIHELEWLLQELVLLWWMFLLSSTAACTVVMVCVHSLCPEGVHYLQGYEYFGLKPEGQGKLYAQYCAPQQHHLIPEAVPGMHEGGWLSVCLTLRILFFVYVCFSLCVHKRFSMRHHQLYVQGLRYVYTSSCNP